MLEDVKAFLKHLLNLMRGKGRNRKRAREQEKWLLNGIRACARV
jgi:hypothetical protein